MQDGGRRNGQRPIAGGGSWTVAHDFFFQYGGAERVTAALVTATGADRVVALGGDPALERKLGLASVEHRLPGATARDHRRRSLAFPALAAVQPAVDGDLLSSSYAFAHHVRARGTHLVYCHSPLRQIWSGAQMYSRRAGALTRPVFGALRAADVRAARRADGYIATNQVVASRIRSFYGIDPVAVIPPAIDETFYREHSPTERIDLLWVGRIVEPYKKLGVLIEAMRMLPDRELTVVGEGRDRARLEATAPANVHFVGARGTQELARTYRAARFAVFPSEDDFGMVPVEAMAAGTPVIALRAGGATETVVDGRTGVFFDAAEPRQIVDAVEAAAAVAWDRVTIRGHAEQYSQSRFIERVQALLRGS